MRKSKKEDSHKSQLFSLQTRGKYTMCALNQIAPAVNIMEEIILTGDVRKMLIIMIQLRSTQYGHVCFEFIHNFFHFLFFCRKGPSVVLPTGRRAIRQPVECGNVFFAHTAYSRVTTTIKLFDIFVVPRNINVCKASYKSSASLTIV